MIVVVPLAGKGIGGENEKVEERMIQRFMDVGLGNNKRKSLSTKRKVSVVTINSEVELRNRPWRRSRRDYILTGIITGQDQSSWIQDLRVDGMLGSTE